MADSILTLHLVRRGCTPGSLAEKILGSGGAMGARESFARITEQLAGVASGALEGRAIVRIDGSLQAAASGSVACTYGSSTAGDRLFISIPGMPPFTLTAVAGTAVAASGQYSLATATDTAVAQSLRDAINAVARLNELVSATESAGTVTITADVVGTAGNDIAMAKSVTTAGALTITAMSGGADAGQRPTATATCGTANITADDTISIGGVTLTWKASAASEDEVTLSATEATAATNLGAAINAHTKLQGLVSASVATAVVTVTWLGDPRTAQLVSLARVEVNSGSVTWSAAAFTPLTTESYGGTAPLSFAMGAP